jgi:hypothetical protein
MGRNRINAIATALAVVFVWIWVAAALPPALAAPKRAHHHGRQPHCTPEPHVNLAAHKSHHGPAAHARRVCLPKGNKAVRLPAPQLGGGYANARIAEVGLSRLGQHGGQCKEAVNIWVAIASNGTQHLGGDYLANYRAEGGVEVGRDQAAEGDIIQLNGPDGHYYYEGMHTAVVVSHAPGSNNFVVVDSNWNWHETVMRHEWNPYASAAAHGLSVHIWRMGSTGSPPAEAGQPVSQGQGIGPAPGLTDLDFIKTANTAGTVEVHWATAESKYQQRGGDYTSDFALPGPNDGTWDLFGSANGAPELGFIDMASSGTGTGTVEPHWDILSGGSYKRAGDYGSDFSLGDKGNGTWQLFGSVNGAPELGFVKTANTGGGTVEVHWDTLQGGSYKRAGDYTSDFSPADAGNGTWQLFGSVNGAPELGFVKTANTGGGTVEVHWDTLQGGSYKRAGDYTSDFSAADGPNGAWKLFGVVGAPPELGFVKLQNTQSGTVEPHWDVLGESSYVRAGDSTSDFNPTDANNGSWQLGTF